ncbi:hypothetical protein ACHAXT_008737 [Thalassiosira profunda]
MGFDSLPHEVLRLILSYTDVPSLAALSATQRAEHENIAALAGDDVTWYALVQGRFGIGCNHRLARSSRRHNQAVLVKRGSSSSLSSDGKRSSDRKRRSTSYGGATWRDAYRALSNIMRIPETSITSGSHVSGGGAVFASPHIRGRKRSVADYFGMWCLVTHTQNCRTKTVEGRRRRRRNHHEVVVVREPANLPYRHDRRYIELKLCLQNTKSGFGRIVIPDITALRIASLEEEEYFSSWGWDKWGADYDPTFHMIEVGPWAPKILLRRRFSDDAAAQYQSDLDAEEWNAKASERDIILRPFEVAILSVHISCPEGLVFETDVLSSLASLRLPIVADGWPSAEKSNGNGCVINNDRSIARFVSEESLWEYYSILPGGCLSLTDRSRLVPM